MSNLSVVRYRILIVLYFFFALPVVAGESGYLSNIQKLTQDNNSIAPVFSPSDTTLLAFTRQKYQGIYLLHTSTSVRALSVNKSVDKLTDNERAGFGFAWSGSKIVARFETNGKKQAVTIDTIDKKYTALSKQAVELSLPTVHNTGIFFVQDKNEVKLDTDRMRSQSVANRLTVFEKNGHIIVNDRSVNFPQTECWLPTIAPDAQKVSFECWQGIYVYDITKNRTFHLGKGASVSWTPNSQQLLYEITQDNGVTITKADIMLVNYDGSQPINLTANTNMMTRRPSINANNQQIAFDDGENIYLADITLGSR